MHFEAIVLLGSFAFIGFLLKALIVFNVEMKSKIAQNFVVLCLFFIASNVAEFLGYFTYLGSHELGEFFVHAYLVSLYFIFPAVLLFAMTMAKSPNVQRASIILYSISTLLTAAHIGGYMIAGFEFLGWSVISIPSKGFWLAMSYILVCTISTVVYLAFQVKRNKDAEIRYNCKINLYAFTPIMVVAFVVLLFRLAGYSASSAVSLPIATIIFLAVLLLHTNGNLFWLSTKFKTIFAIINMDKNASIDSIIGQIEKIRIEEALKVTSGQQKLAAKLINVPASTFNKKITKYNIDI